MNSDSHEPRELTSSPCSLPEGTSRHDGWTGERMGTFCETLAETGLVVDACLAAGKSTNTAYSVRRRNPLFAAAWEAALTIARERLADTLLTRSIEGVVEQYYKDGELVGERRVMDSRLGLAILRRLDRLAETGSPFSTRGERLFTVAPHTSVRPACPNRAHPELVEGRARQIDWDLALSALRSGEEDAIAEALAMFEGPALSMSKGDEAREAHDPPNSLSQGDGNPPEDDGTILLSDRIWEQDECGEAVWLTDFPPPPGYEGYQSGAWGDEGYERECTPEERALMIRDTERELAEDRAADEALRDACLAALREGAEADADTNASC